MPVTNDHDDYSFAPAIPSPQSVSVTHYSKRMNQHPDTPTLYRSRYSAEESSDEAHQIDLQNRRFQLKKRRVVMFSIAILSFCMIAMIARVNKFLSGMNLSDFTIRMANAHDNLALRDSDGFFSEISADEWEKLMHQTKTLLGDQDALNADPSTNYIVEPKAWWLKNWQANFPCHEEVMIHNKFICDPFRIISLAIEYLNAGGNAGRECLVYVSGGDDIGFGNQFLDYTLATVTEVGLTTPVCDVHIFNPNLQARLSCLISCDIT